MKSNIPSNPMHLRDKSISSKMILFGETKYGNIFFMKAQVKKQAACLA